MKSIQTNLAKEPLLKVILRLARENKRKVYLVGGYLRDIILGRRKKVIDLDFSVNKQAINFAKLVANKIKGSFVLLDAKHGSSRVVFNKKNQLYTLDFTDFRSSTIEKDLMRRDFTVNTLTLDLQNIKNKFDLGEVLIDPYGAIADLKMKKVRVVSKYSFLDDPLRIVRAFSMAAILDFEIDPDTLSQIKDYKEKLPKIAGERIRDEFFKVLDTDKAADYLKLMDKFEVLNKVIPEIEIMRGIEQGPYHHLDVWQHSLETVAQLDYLMKQLKRNEKIQNYLDEEINLNRSRRALIKLGALLHDIGKPQTMEHKNGKTRFHGHERVGREYLEEICERLKLSNDEKDALEKVVFWHLRPGYLADNEFISERAIFRYFRDTAEEGVSILLISVADQRATRGPLTSNTSRRYHEKVARDLMKRFFKNQDQKKPRRLITGDDLIKNLRLFPSPIFSKILSEIEEAQAIGAVKTKKQALDLARKIAKR